MDPEIRLWRGLQVRRPAESPPMHLFYARLLLTAAARVLRTSQPGYRKQASLSSIQ